MKQEQNKSVRMKTLTLLLAAAPPIGVVTTGLPLEQDAASKAYQKAYGLVLDERWTEAKKALDDYLKSYPKGSLTDAASFWHCYPREKLKETPEDVFESY